jgi:hypothetical protein
MNEQRMPRSVASKDTMAFRGRYHPAPVGIGSADEIIGSSSSLPLIVVKILES